MVFILRTVLLLLFLPKREGGMSVAKLLLSGLLVASGLILGAFTLHAWLAPEWEVQASAAVGRYGKPQAVDALPEPDRAAAGDVPDNWAPRLTKTDPKPDSKPAAASDEAAKAKKRPAEKKPAEKQQQKADKAKDEQTLLSWLSGLISK
jgi:hypothetical protein